MKNKQYIAYYSTEIGILEITGTNKEILSIGFKDDIETRPSETPECLKPCVSQLDEYFHGKRKKFTLALKLHGTDFQKRVWSALSDIPYGITKSYKDIATVIGNKKAVRAVGGANGNNPIGIIIPCHRVIGNNGKLVGYGDGVWRKKWLLDHEKKYLYVNA